MSNGTDNRDCAGQPDCDGQTIRPRIRNPRRSCVPGSNEESAPSTAFATPRPMIEDAHAGTPVATNASVNASPVAAATTAGSTASAASASNVHRKCEPVERAELSSSRANATHRQVNYHFQLLVTRFSQSRAEGSLISSASSMINARLPCPATMALRLATSK